MPHIYSENIHHVCRLRTLIPAAVSLILFLICSAPPSAAEDGLVEHIGLTTNPKEHEAILAALKPKSPQVALKRWRAGSLLTHHKSFVRQQEQIATQSEPTQAPQVEGYYLKMYAAESVVVTDAQGNSSPTAGETPAVPPVPGVNISQDEIVANIILPAKLPAGESYTITFRSTGKPMIIDITKGIGNAPEAATQIIRYLDLNLPAGTALVLKFTPQGVENLRYDTDGDGTFETAVSPTASASGRAAQDVNAPYVTFSEKVQGTQRLITINAEDKETGVKIVRYSLDGKKYQPYTTPLSINPCQTRTVYAIADDSVGNRSGTFTYAISKLALGLSLPALCVNIGQRGRRSENGRLGTQQPAPRQTQARPSVREKKRASGSISDEGAAAYYVYATGLNHITVTDADGNSNTPLAETTLRRISGIGYEESTGNVEVMLPVTPRAYTLKFQSAGQPIALEIVKGVGNSSPTEAVRYLDLSLPVDAVAMLRVSGGGVEELRYDRDGDGIFESVVRPTAAVVGEAALDVDPPALIFKHRIRGARKLITILARDKGAGVKAVHYSIDGAHFQLYTEPLLIDPAQTKIVYAFADDQVANRSAMATYRVPGSR